MTHRLTQPFANVDSLLDSVHPRPPVPVFKVPREALRRLLKQALAELHDARRRAKGTPDEPDYLNRIALWEALLVWVKAPPGEQVHVVGAVRAANPPPGAAKTSW